METHQVDVWTWSLDAPVPPKLQSALSDDERQRAHRFVNAKAASRFVSGRAVLRNILAHYLETEPGQLDFSYGPHGKPALRGAPGRVPHFNVSHSGHLAVLALCQHAEIGVDIESIRPLREDVAQFFSVGERKALAKLSGAEAIHRFYRLWTCKEAVLKALGSGLAIPLDTFEIEFTAGEPPSIAFLDRLQREIGPMWHLREFEPAAGFAGALALQAMPGAVVFNTLLPSQGDRATSEGQDTSACAKVVIPAKAGVPLSDRTGVPRR